MKPIVKRTQYTRRWYWKCKQCDRAMYGHPSWGSAWFDALFHASRDVHHNNSHPTLLEGATIV